MVSDWVVKTNSRLGQTEYRQCYSWKPPARQELEGAIRDWEWNSDFWVFQEYWNSHKIDFRALRGPFGFRANLGAWILLMCVAWGWLTSVCWCEGIRLHLTYYILFKSFDRYAWLTSESKSFVLKRKFYCKLVGKMIIRLIHELHIHHITSH